MTPEIVDRLVKKQPKLKALRARLEALKPGAMCLHPNWGLGMVKDYDPVENKLLFEFKQSGKPDHKMDPIFCVQKLNLLSENHVLVRRYKEPEAIDRLLKEDPAELIIAILSQYENQSATNAQIERLLSLLIGPIKYKKWWSNTKKLLVKDPRIAIPEKKTIPYILRDKLVKPEQEVLEEFYTSKSIKRQIQLAEKLIALSIKHEDIKEQLPNILQTLTNGIKNSRQLNQAERLQAIWVRNDLARFIHEDPEILDPPSASIIEAEAHNLSQLAARIVPAYYKRFLQLLRNSRQQDWQKLAFDLLRHSTGRFTHECILFLMEQDLEESIKETLKRWLNEQALKEPLLTWILKYRHSRRYAAMLEDLITPRLLNALFYAIDYEALQNTTNRRIPLAEIISEDRELIGELLTEANYETVRDLATMLLLNQGFEDLSKKSILARFIRIFPEIQELITGKEETDKQETPQGLLVSTQSYEARRREYQALVQEKIPENQDAIAIAREHGDLRENAEYKMARQEQDTLLALKVQIEQDLAQARQIDFNDAPTDVIGIGSSVELKLLASGQCVTYAILGAWDSDPDNSILSYQTPLAQARLGEKVGDTVTINLTGTQEAWIVQGIQRYIDQPA